MESQDIPPPPAEVNVRAEKSRKHFLNEFQKEPEFYVRVPGRVNLIGEHIDYCGYDVFPMAIEQDVFLSISKADFPSSTLRLSNVDSKYKSAAVELNNIKSILSNRGKGVAPDWTHYFYCGVQGVMEHLNISASASSFDVSVDGAIPPSAGLSSSSAIVVAAAIATLLANGHTMPKSSLATLCAQCERYIGTEGGGMDQAIAILANKGTAQHIQFFPSLSGVEVQLPPNAIFVIANCLSEANKAASSSFNTRVAECRLAAWILSKAFQPEVDPTQFNKLRDLQERLGYSLSRMRELVEEHLHPQIYQAEEICEILGMSVNAISQMPIFNKIQFPTTAFELYKRAAHVFEEADRVDKFHSACLEGSLESMGTLMKASHKSLRENYECSHPFLDVLVDISEPVSYGVRLTGAGWGGCVVALVDQSQLPTYLETLMKKFYLPIHGQTELNSRHVFVTAPGPGACIWKI